VSVRALTALATIAAGFALVGAAHVWGSEELALGVGYGAGAMMIVVALLRAVEDFGR